MTATPSAPMHAGSVEGETPPRWRGPTGVPAQIPRGWIRADLRSDRHRPLLRSFSRRTSADGVPTTGRPPSALVWIRS